MVKRKASPAQLRALAKGRATLKAMRKRGAAPKKKRRRNPGPPARGAVMGRDIPKMQRGLGTRLSTQQKAAKKTLRRYPQTSTRQQGYASNPPHYVIKSSKGFFDGAGWSTTKKGAAQYLIKQKAATIGQKIANATNKQVSIVPV